MPSARKGPVAPESKKQSQPSERRGPTAVKGPRVDPSVMEDAKRQEAAKQEASSEKVEVPQQGKEPLSVDFIQTDAPSQPDQAVKQGPEGTPAQPFNIQEVRTTSTGAELGGLPPTSRSPIPDPEEIWEPYPEVRFDPANPAVQAQTYVQPATGAVAEKLVGQVSEEQELRPAGSALVPPTTTENK